MIKNQDRNAAKFTVRQTPTVRHSSATVDAHCWTTTIAHAVGRLQLTLELKVVDTQPHVHLPLHPVLADLACIQSAVMVSAAAKSAISWLQAASKAQTSAQRRPVRQTISVNSFGSTQSAFLEVVSVI